MSEETGRLTMEIKAKGVEIEAKLTEDQAWSLASELAEFAERLQNQRKLNAR